MSAAESRESQIAIRLMSFGDLDAMFSIDRKIRASGKAVTYAKLTAEHIFTIDRKVSHQRRPTSYADLITGEVSGVLDFGFVAEIEGHVRGFILGKVTRLGEAATEEGLVLIMGVHPDYQRRGIATKLVNALLDKFRARGIKKIRTGIDQRDKDLLGFAEHMGFNVGHLVVYPKTL